MKRIKTMDTSGKPNGWLLPLWNANDEPSLRPDQVYVTAIAPHSRKGPHLHMKRRGLFAVVLGSCRFVFRVNGEIRSVVSSVTDGFQRGPSRIVVPTGVACALYNDTDDEVLVVNMPSPAWRADEPDDWPVEGWVD